MVTKSPASAPPSPEERHRLESARGDLRDAVGSVRNLAELLRSVRVGPKAISSVLPAVHASCGLIDTSTRGLIELIGTRVPGAPALNQVLAAVEPRTRELDHALTVAGRRPMTAKNRLGLEATVGRVARELDAARGLVDLLDDAVWGSGVLLDLGDLIRDSGEGPGLGDPTQRATLELGSPGQETLQNPRVTLALVGIGARLVAQGGGTPAITVNGAAVEITPGSGAGRVIALRAVTLIAPTLPCAELAAARAGVRMAWSPADRRFTLAPSS